VDAKTRLILYKLVNQDLLESVNGVISTGKESVVFHAVGGRSVSRVSSRWRSYMNRLKRNNGTTTKFLVFEHHIKIFT